MIQGFQQKKSIIFLLLASLCIFNVDAQKKIPHAVRTNNNSYARRTEIIIPQLKGYNVYKGDFHIHTSYSDGAFSPEKIVDTAIDAGLEAIAITDHDNVLSHQIALDYAKDKSLKILPGVEINTIYKGYEVHILGYFMDLEDSDFQKLIKTQQQARVKQTKEIITLLAKRAGIKITLDSIVSQVAPGGSIGRPHIARAITSAGGTQNVIEAYANYINDDSPVYIQRKTVKKLLQNLA